MTITAASKSRQTEPKNPKAGDANATADARSAESRTADAKSAEGRAAAGKSGEGRTADGKSAEGPIAAASRARVTAIEVFAKSPLWRGPPGWDRHWPAGETVVGPDELGGKEPELVEAMIEALTGDAMANFAVTVERGGKGSAR